MYLLQSTCGGMFVSDTFMDDFIAPFVMASVATMLLVLALYYMAAHFFKRQEYESFVSIELHQVLVSLMLFLVLMGATCFAASLASSLAGGDMFSIAHDYVNTISNKIALPAILNLEKEKLFLQWWGSLSYRWGLSVWGTQLPAFPSLAAFERTADFLLMLLSPFVASLMAQEIGLEIIRATMIPYVLPVGLVLRIFPPTRDAGSFLICTAIAFAIVFPFTYVMHSKIVYSMLIEDKIITDPNITPPQYTELDMLDIQFKDAYPNLDYAVNRLGIFSIKDWINHIAKLSYLLMQAVFLPALSMILTIAFLRGTQKFMSQKLE